MPVNFWEKVSNVTLELIFQHFTFDDIFDVCEVSKSWNNLIAGSETCMDKILINVGKDDSNELDLKSSFRKYKHLKLHRVSTGIIDYLTNGSFQTVNMLMGSLDSVQCTQLLQTISQDIREVEFYIENIDGDLMTPVSFPNLETVTFRWTTSRIFEPLFGNENKKLRNVTIELNKSGCNEAVASFLVKNICVENLSTRLCNEDYCQLFDEDFSVNNGLNLQTLSFYWRNINFVQPEIVENLKKFFISQSKCLKRFVFECTFDCKSLIELIVNETKTLEHLTFVDLDDVSLLESDKMDFNLLPNPAIKQIDVCVNWFISSDMFNDLIIASPNLEILYIFELSIATLEFLAKNTKKLRHLIYEEIDNDCESFYSDLITCDRDNQINKFINIHWDQDFEIDYPELHQKMQFV